MIKSKSMFKLCNKILKSSRFADMLRMFCVKILSHLCCELLGSRVRISKASQVEAVETDMLSILFNNSVSTLNFGN